jgi:MFS family permease
MTSVAEPAKGPVDGDVVTLFLTRGVRLFAYGALSVVLVLHLAAAGLSPERIGLLLTLTLLGDTAVSLLVTTRADRAGRRRMLALGAALMVGAGLLFATTTDFWLLLVGATLGILSPSGNEVGPFLAIEQAALSDAVGDRERTRAFARYTLTGSFATAVGALAGGTMAEGLQRLGWSPLASYRAVVVLYALLGLGLLALFARLSPAVEPPATTAGAAGGPGRRAGLGLHRSRGRVFRLSGLFAVDAFAGGLIVQSYLAAWLHARFGAGEALIGAIFLGANVLAGLSALAAPPLARRFGLVNTMVFTHLPSNLVLLAVPFMPTLALAAGLLFLRFSISQLDVPTRQSYTMAVVSADERAAAAGVTGMARTVGASLAPVLAGPLYAVPALAWVPFAVCGVLKIGYDVALWRAFAAVRPPEERAG